MRFRTVALFLLLNAFAHAAAQASVYVVQPGDTLFAIARSFGVSVAELISVNAIVDEDLIAVGQQLTIPGALEWPASLPAPFEEVSLAPEVAVQGRVQALRLRLAPGAEAPKLRYLEAGVPLVQRADGSYLALLVTPVLQAAGRSQLTLVAESAGGSEALVLPVVVREGGYEREEIWLSAETSSLLEPSIVSAEHALVEGTCAGSGSDPSWAGNFRYPVGNPRVTSSFGTLRSYNGGPYRNFHRGLDFDGEVGTPVYAAAAGVVLLSEALQVRGEAVILGHGLGVCSGYMHLSRRLVEAGATVAAGDLLGYVGASGLVTGPHLHWEVRVGGVPVAPLQWIEEPVGE